MPRVDKTASRRGRPWRAIAVLALWAPGAVLAAGEGFEPQAAAGLWDLTLTSTNKQCRITLRMDSVARGFALAMPAGCRRALPVLGEVIGWSKEADGLALKDLSGAVILQFQPRADGSFEGQSTAGEVYSFVAVDQTKRAQFVKPTAEKPVGLRPTAGFQVAQAKPSVAATPAAAVKPGEVPGRYSVWREGPKDTGCMLTLDDKARGPKGSFKALLSPACRDQGVVIFDPAGWAVEKGRLVLTARKGHQAHFDLQPDVGWNKDPKDGGRPLVLKKM
jgi:hypothetical protein